ncbi:hypothetical protein M231_08064 [Tremella mesenterica]|uniref:ATP-dependent DNA helicase n=1 Tax=Tremella mesenterica TaxID=5217 RepID=A0A4Q1BF58_TREME|nr:hypothetical protein M231_08064 [Tremella mesenterica]
MATKILCQQEVASKEQVLGDWPLMCQEGGSHAVQLDIGQQLGLWDMDKAEDWHKVTWEWGVNGEDERTNALEEWKKTLVANASPPPVNILLLNNTQKRVHSKVMKHTQTWQNGRPAPSFLLNINGTAGTGNSSLNDPISQSLDHFTSPSNCVKHLAPTGVAASNIAEQTHPSALGLSADNNKAEPIELSGTQLATLQEEWNMVKYLILDKKSMIGRKALGCIHTQLGFIFPASSHLPFGGLIVQDDPKSKLQADDNSPGRPPTQGLVNGTKGRVHSIGLREGDEAGIDLPSVVMVAFPTFQGQTSCHNEVGTPRLPITPVIVTWDGPAGTTCSRTQFPLQLVYAIAIYKPQGATLDRACVHIGNREFATGLTFVVVSRVRVLSELAFWPGFPIEQIVRSGNEQGGAGAARRMVQEDEVRRRGLRFLE